MQYEYKVVPTPAPPRKTPGVKGAEAKFAYGLEAAMNTYATDGWEYLRADILPSEERRGFRSTQTVYRTVLVFRRAIAAPISDRADDSQALATPQPQSEPQIDRTAEPGYETPPAPAPAPEPEPTYEEAREAERNARFSLVGPARRGDETGAPPLSAPHVHGDDAGGSDDRR